MPWSNGVFTRNNGTFSGLTVWRQSALASRKIRDDDHDIHDEDIADGINNTIAKDGSNAPTADLPMNGRKHSNVEDAANRNEYASYGQLLDSIVFMDAAFVGGTGNVITFTPVPAYTAYVEGQVIGFNAKINNTGPATLSISGLPATALVKENNIALELSDLEVDVLYFAVYDGTRFKLLGSKSVVTGLATQTELNSNNPPGTKAVPADARANSGNYGLSRVGETELNTKADASALAAKANLASPAFTNNPTAPTQATSNASTRLANTAFVHNAVEATVHTSYSTSDTYFSGDVVVLTQAEYNAITSPVAGVQYMISA